jgi:hypothetical protein
MRRLLCLAVLAICALAPAAAAQAPNHSLRLNHPAPAGQYLSVTEKTGLENLSALTIEAWVYPTVYAGTQTIVGNDHATSFWLVMLADGKLRFYPAGAASSVTSAAALPLGRWTHVAATYSQSLGIARVYINGAISASQPGLTGTTGAASGDLRVGADREGAVADHFWRGYLDEVRLWNQSVSAARLADDRYHRGGTAADQGGYYAALVADWTLDSLPAGEAAFPDLRGAHPAARVNAPAMETGVCPQLDYCTALSLGGVTDYANLGAAPDLSAGVTLEAWIYPTVFSGTPTIVGRDYDTGSWLGLANQGKVRFYPKGGAGAYLESSAAVPLARWSHVAGVYRDGLTRVLIDGVVDRTSAAFTGPIVDNGRAFYAGADNDPGSVKFYFAGRLDEVRVLGGPRSPQQIRETMFYPTVADVLPDEDGVLRPLVNGHCEPSLPSGTTLGGTAHWVQSGAPLYGDPAPSYRGDLQGFYLAYTGKEVSGSGPLEILDSLYVPVSAAISDVDVFVNLEFSSSTGSELGLAVQLLPPAGGATIDLFSSGPAFGRDLQTRFDDESPNAIEDLLPPFLEGVRPREALAGLDGRGTAGLWRLRVTPAGATVRCRLNQWGVRFNDASTVSAPPAAAAGGVRLALAGAHPVRGAGRLEYSLPAPAGVDLAVYDLRGGRVLTLARGPQAAGTHAAAWRTRGLAPGVYFVRLVVDGGARAQLKVVVVD